jgi:hypothetical protein
VSGEAVARGFSRSSMDGVEVEASALDGKAADEELAGVIRLELRTDAAHERT